MNIPTTGITTGVIVIMLVVCAVLYYVFNRKQRFESIKEINYKIGRITSEHGCAEADVLFGEIKQTMERFSITPQELAFADMAHLRHAARTSLDLHIRHLEVLVNRTTGELDRIHRNGDPAINEKCERLDRTVVMLGVSLDKTRERIARFDREHHKKHRTPAA